MQSPDSRDRIWRVLNTAERNGQRCGGPVLLSGMVVGPGLVELSAGPLGQNSRFSLELLTLLVLQLVGPLVVSLLAMALMMLNWLGNDVDVSLGLEYEISSNTAIYSNVAGSFWSNGNELTYGGGFRYGW